MLKSLPLRRPEPDARGFIDGLLGRSRPARTPLVEYLVDDAVMRPVVEGMLGRSWAPWPADPADRGALKAHLDMFLDFWMRLGYDCVRFERGLPFPESQVVSTAAEPGSGKLRAWADEHAGRIASWEDFECYPWPKVEEFDFFPYEYLNGRLPEGAGLLCCHAGGVFEHLSWIMSYEGLAFALAENPELVAAVAERVGGLLEAFTRRLLELDRLAGIFAGDDMGFRSATLVSPAALRRYTLPRHQRLAALAHEKGVPYFLHSCGNLAAIMGDLIDGVGIDGKHSFEDAILPAEDFQARHGDRIAVLGGVDVNVLALGTEAGVRRRTRELIEICGGRGRYAVGSGNSIPSYVPAANFLAMVDEALS